MMRNALLHVVHPEQLRTTSTDDLELRVLSLLGKEAVAGIRALHCDSHPLSGRLAQGLADRLWVPAGKPLPTGMPPLYWAGLLDHFAHRSEGDILLVALASTTDCAVGHLLKHGRAYRRTGAVGWNCLEAPPESRTPCKRKRELATS